MTTGRQATNRIVTVPNALSALRILLIPVFVVMLLREPTRLAGILLLGVVASTDWVDGFIARRTGQVTELGKLLDPLADRLALIAALVTFVVIGGVPLWAALLLLVRDALILIAGVILGARGVRIAVRPMGKFATFTLWWGIGLIAWGALGYALAAAALVLGWTWFVVGTVEYYAATAAYVADARRALAA